MKVACLWFEEKVNTNKIAELCLRFSPQICIREDRAVFIEIGKCKKLYSENGFLARMQVILRRLNLQASIGMGNDITDALLRAKYQVQNIEALPLTALIDLADPFNKDLIIQKYIQKMIFAFTDLGVKNLKAFKEIPASELISRFGPVGILCRQRILAETFVPWPLWKPSEIIQEKSEFPYFDFYGELEPLLFELKKHLDQIFQRLWARACKAQSLEVKVKVETNSLNPKPFRSFEFDFLYPQSTTKTALSIIKERLSRDFEKNPVRTPILGLETTVLTMVPATSGQRSLLHNNEDLDEQLFSLLNQLAEAHGAENIFHAELTEERRPEKSWRKTVDEKSKALNPAQPVDLQQCIPQRPTYLIKPEQVQITAGFLYIRKKPYKIVNWPSHVERITGGWIEKSEDLNNSYDRNYYNIDLEAGGRVTIFQTPSEHYFLHGYFG